MVSDKIKVSWYDLKDTEILYLKKSEAYKIIQMGIKKSGSLSKLCSKINSAQPYSILESNKGISVKTLKRLMNFLHIDLDSINDEIVEIRKWSICSVKNPKFPIDLENAHLGFISGHLMSDGCLYYDKSRKNLIRTKYCSNEKCGIENFISSINSIFGKVHFNLENERNCTTIKIGNGIVGEVFEKAGVTVGKKYAINGHIPWIITRGSKEMKKLYLSAIFDDEGSVGKSLFPYVILSRNIHVNVTKKERKILRTYVNSSMVTSYFPTGHSKKSISIGALKRVLDKNTFRPLIYKILNSKPQILIDESELLKKDFEINNSTYVISLTETSNGNYSVKSSLVIRNKKDIVKFYQEIGFSLPGKQNKLRQALNEKSWFGNGVTPIQYVDKEKTSISTIEK